MLLTRQSWLDVIQNSLLKPRRESSLPEFEPYGSLRVGKTSA